MGVEHRIPCRGISLRSMPGRGLAYCHGSPGLSRARGTWPMHGSRRLVPRRQGGVHGLACVGLLGELLRAGPFTTCEPAPVGALSIVAGVVGDGGLRSCGSHSLSRGRDRDRPGSVRNNGCGHRRQHGSLGVALAQISAGPDARSLLHHHWRAPSGDWAHCFRLCAVAPASNEATRAFQQPAAGDLRKRTRLSGMCAVLGGMAFAYGRKNATNR